MMSGEDGAWPRAASSFEADLGDGLVAGFTEVSGLDTETRVIEYRGSNSPAFSAAKLPGLVKYGNVTLKRGVFVSDRAFQDWFERSRRNDIVRRRVIIRLLDEERRAVVTWTLANAWPTKISGPTLKADGNEVAIETLELAHEGLSIARS